MQSGTQPTNKAVVYKGQGKVAVEEVPFPNFDLTLQTGEMRHCPHGVILKVLATNICGSDMHMVRGRTNAEPGLILGHEITGEVFMLGSDVETMAKGDWVTVPFNVACGRCGNCKNKLTNICSRTSPLGFGGAYGYVNMGGWPGGQGNYVLVPYADWNCLKLAKTKINERNILDVAFLSDILPTAYHGCLCAEVTTGSTVYIAGAGPVGLCAIGCCKILGAANIIVGDYNTERLAQARNMGAMTIDLNQDPEIVPSLKKLIGRETVDACVECAGFETNGHHGYSRKKPEEITEVMNTLITITKIGGCIGVMGLYLSGDPGASDKKAQMGILPMNYGMAWMKGLKIAGGQCPTMQYQDILLEAIMAGKLEVAKYMNVQVISLEEAPKAYSEFNEGVAKKFILDPNGMLRNIISKGTTA